MPEIKVKIGDVEWSTMSNYYFVYIIAENLGALSRKSKTYTQTRIFFDCNNIKYFSKKHGLQHIESDEWKFGESGSYCYFAKGAVNVE